MYFISRLGDQCQANVACLFQVYGTKRLAAKQCKVFFNSSSPLCISRQGSSKVAVRQHEVSDHLSGILRLYVNHPAKQLQL